MRVFYNGKRVESVDRRFKDRRVFLGKDERIGVPVESMPKRRLRSYRVALRISFIQWIKILAIVAGVVVLYMDLVNRNII